MSDMKDMNSRSGRLGQEDDPAEIVKALLEQYDLLAAIQQHLFPSSAAVQIACARHQMSRAARFIDAALQSHEKPSVSS